MLLLDASIRERSVPAMLGKHLVERRNDRDHKDIQRPFCKRRNEMDEHEDQHVEGVSTFEPVDAHETSDEIPYSYPYGMDEETWNKRLREQQEALDKLLAETRRRML